jgi:hypothetical protein
VPHPTNLAREKKRIRTNHERVNAPSRHVGKRRIDFLLGAGTERCPRPPAWNRWPL